LKDKMTDCEESRRLKEAIASAHGLVFDCDGTLLDTMPIYYQSWKRSCDEVGLHFPVERFYAKAGAPVKDIFQMLIDEQMPASGKLTAEYCEEVKRRHHAQIEADGQLAGPIDVVVDICKRFHGTMPMAVASSGWRDHVLSGLERIGILHLFDVVVTACDDGVKKGKPAPDIFLVAAERLGVCPTKCIGFEDADFGMQALKDAKYHYASDVRLMHMYPRNVEKRQQEEQKQPL
jgi:beta-phosphoglucomutase-like phosphatase (HAD superfamily)